LSGEFRKISGSRKSFQWNRNAKIATVESAA